jgi:hypothetical protein
MIIASELRTGNLLSLGGKWVIVDGQAIRDITMVPGVPEKFERIRLTREILIRCGFRDGKLPVSNDVGWRFMLEVDEGEIVLAVKEYALPLRIKYLHELQNLYHALTGDELNIVL